MQAVAALDAEGNPIGEYRYDGAVANKALELLGRHLGMFTERQEIAIRSTDNVIAQLLERVEQSRNTIVDAEYVERAALGTLDTSLPRIS